MGVALKERRGFFRSVRALKMNMKMVQPRNSLMNLYPSLQTTALGRLT